MFSTYSVFSTTCTVHYLLVCLYVVTPVKRVLKVTVNATGSKIDDRHLLSSTLTAYAVYVRAAIVHDAAYGASVWYPDLTMVLHQRK